MSKEQRLSCDAPHILKKTMVDVILFLKKGHPRSLFGLFLVFFNQTTQISKDLNSQPSDLSILL